MPVFSSSCWFSTSRNAKLQNQNWIKSCDWGLNGSPVTCAKALRCVDRARACHWQQLEHNKSTHAWIEENWSIKLACYCMFWWVWNGWFSAVRAFSWTNTFEETIECSIARWIAIVSGLSVLQSDHRKRPPQPTATCSDEPGAMEIDIQRGSMRFLEVPPSISPSKACLVMVFASVAGASANIWLPKPSQSCRKHSQLPASAGTDVLSSIGCRWVGLTDRTLDGSKWRTTRVSKHGLKKAVPRVCSDNLLVLVVDIATEPKASGTLSSGFPNTARPPRPVD